MGFYFISDCLSHCLGIILIPSSNPCILNHTLTKNITQVWDTSAEYQTSCLQRVWYSADVSQTSVIFFARVWFNIYHSFQPITCCFFFFVFLAGKLLRILINHWIMTSSNIITLLDLTHKRTKTKPRDQVAVCTQNPWSSGQLQILLILSRFEVISVKVQINVRLGQIKVR